MTAVRQALYSKLTGASAVTDLLATSTSVYHGQAPEGAAYPFVIFHQQAGTRTRAQGKTTAFVEETWLVKAVDENSTSDTAEAIAEAVEATLANGTLTVTGRTLHDVYPSGDVNYLERDGDRTYRHHGANYRVVTSAA